MSLQDFRPMMERCSNCLGCKWIPFDKVQSQRFGENCPSIGFYQFNTYSARGRFQLAQAILDGDADYTATLTELVHSCMQCGSCDVSCKICRYNLEPLEHNIALKADAVEKGKTLPVQDDMLINLRNEKTLLIGKKKADRSFWAKGLAVKNVMQDKADVIFFPGCKYSYDIELTGKARAMVRILLDAGLDVGTLGNAETCCAARAFQMGFTGDFEQQAHENIKKIKMSGAKTIVTPCGDCYHAFKRLYAELGLDIEVLHMVELLDRLISDGRMKLTKPVDLTVTYHDPCHLGRQGEPYVPWEGKEKKIRKQIHTWDPPRPRYNGVYGIYDAPRNVIKSIPGIRFVEMERIREYAWCCGAGGGCSETLPEYAAWTAGERIEEANSTGAMVLITACPWCASNLGSAAVQNGNRIIVMDLFDLVQQAL